MTLQSKPLIDLTEKAIQILYREMGVVDTVRFLRQYREGAGDYTRDRQKYAGDETLDELIDEIKHRRDL